MKHYPSLPSRRGGPAVLLAIAAVLLFSTFAPAQSVQQATERSIKNKVPAHVPLQIKISPAKEAKIKDPRNKDWVHDIEIEITNSSDKPIYYFDLFLETDLTSDRDITMAFYISYGRAGLVDISSKPRPEDVPLLRNQTYTYVVPEKKASAWEAWLKRNNKTAMVLEITFSHLSFGDGTGLTSSGAIPVPVKQ